MSPPEFDPGPPQVGGGHSRKEPFEQLVNSYSEHLHRSTRPMENARDMAPHRHVLHEHTYMNTHEQHQD
jgi:hypothetical protein